MSLLCSLICLLQVLSVVCETQALYWNLLIVGGVEQYEYENRPRSTRQNNTKYPLNQNTLNHDSVPQGIYRGVMCIM